MRIVHSLQEAEWRRFIHGNHHSNVFHTPEMFHVFSQAKGHRPTLWAAKDGRGQVLAMFMPVQITLRDGLLRRLTTRAVAYGSVLCDPSPAGEDAMSMLLKTYVRTVGNEALFTELRNLSDLSHLQPILNRNRFVYEDHLNYLVCLAGSPEKVLQRIGRRTRKNLRRALRQGAVIVEEANRLEQVALCYDLLLRSYNAAKVPLADRSLFEATFNILHPRGMVKFLLARKGDRYIAASVELMFKDTIYGWYGGMDRKYGHDMPNELLLWHIFEWGADKGYAVYDFGGAGTPDEEYGVRDFKAKFGGELVCFGRNTCVHVPTVLAISERGYRIYRKLMGSKL